MCSFRGRRWPLESGSAWVPRVRAFTPLLAFSGEDKLQTALLSKRRSHRSAVFYAFRSKLSLESTPMRPLAGRCGNLDIGSLRHQPDNNASPAHKGGGPSAIRAARRTHRRCSYLQNSVLHFVHGAAAAAFLRQHLHLVDMKRATVGHFTRHFHMMAF